MCDSWYVSWYFTCCEVRTNKMKKLRLSVQSHLLTLKDFKTLICVKKRLYKQEMSVFKV